MRKLLTIILVTGYLLLYGVAYFSPNINPNDFWYTSILGLAFPYIFFAGILLFLFLFTSSSKVRWMLLIALIPGFFKLNLFIRFQDGSHFVGKENSIKVVSYNVRSFNRYRWIDSDNVLPDILRILKNENPDVILFQEFYAADTLKRDSLAKLIGTACNMPFYKGFSPVRNGKSHGVYTFSKYPIIKATETKFHSHGVNGFLETTVQFPTKKVRILNYHLASYQLNAGENPKEKDADVKSALYKLRNGMQRRADQVQLLNKYIQKADNLPLICGGDLNDTPHSFAYQTLSSNLSDSYTEAGSGEGKTYAGKLPGFRIDYIFHNEAFKAEAYHSIKEEKSDHYPISVTLSFKD